MIRIQRLLTFEQYAASTRLTHLHGSVNRKANYYIYLYGVPVLILFVILPVLVRRMRELWALAGTGVATGHNELEFGVLTSFVALALYFLCSPLVFRQKMRKLYRQQELNLPWTLEISEQGIRSIHSGRIETRYEWAYFSRFLETQEFFLMLHPARLLFLSIAKSSLKPAEQEELRTLLAQHLRPAKAEQP